MFCIPNVKNYKNMLKKLSMITVNSASCISQCTGCMCSCRCSCSGSNTILNW